MGPREGTEISTLFLYCIHAFMIGKYETPRGDGNFPSVHFLQHFLVRIGKYETPRGDGNFVILKYCPSRSHIGKYETPRGDGN